MDVLPALAAHYAQPNPALLRAAADRPRAPRTRLAGEQSEWCALIRRLASKSMVVFTTRPAVICGAFGTPKSPPGSGIRFIIDARPANALFVEPPHVELPTPDLLARLVTDGRADRKLFVAKVDLDNFYHRIRIPAWLQRYMALPPVLASDVGLAAQYGANTRIYPCCTTLPMGWSHSVFLAQAAHENIVNHICPSLQPADRITAHTDLRVDRVRHQISIDDLNIFGPTREAVRAAQNEYVGAIRGVTRLVVKDPKVVAPTEHGVTYISSQVPDGFTMRTMIRFC